jgi:cytochrome c biogenesis protein CcdA
MSKIRRNVMTCECTNEVENYPWVLITLFVIIASGLLYMLTMAILKLVWLVNLNWLWVLAPAWIGGLLMFFLGTITMIEFVKTAVGLRKKS